MQDWSVVAVVVFVISLIMRIEFSTIAKGN